MIDRRLLDGNHRQELPAGRPSHESAEVARPTPGTPAIYRKGQPDLGCDPSRDELLRPSTEATTDIRRQSWSRVMVALSLGRFGRDVNPG
jgi:hypothetical protein